MNAPASPPNDVPVQPGTVLAGKYRVDRVLGKGGMGVVVEAHHVVLDERVALKFLLPDYAQHPEASARFHREAQAAVKIKGEHVTRVTDVGTLENGSPYMVMEFLEGIDLSNALEKYGVCRIPDAIDYVLQACEAIAEAHSLGIVHRDIKPANMFLTRRPDGTPMIKVLDFGISKMAVAGVDNLTRTTATMGSALYMSPEQMQQTRGVDHRTDIYALGISLYELLAGKQPYYADTLPQLCAEVLTGTPTPIRAMRAEVPEGLGAALEKAYARDRDQRYQTIAELAAGLAPFAPPRSQTSLDRIARMAGVLPSTAGARGPSLSQPDLPPVAAAGPGHITGPGPGVATSPGHTTSPGAATSPGHTTNPGAQPSAQAQSGISMEIPIGGYQGPMSHRAAAAFKAGASTNANLSSTSPPGAASASSKLGLIAAAAIGVGLLLGGVAYFFLRGPSAATVSPSPAPEMSASAPAPPSASSATIAEPPATAAGSAEPVPSTSAAASASVAPTASASAAPTSKVKTPTKPTSSTAPKKPGVMTSR